MSEPVDPAEALAAKRYFLMNAVRVGSIALLLVGIAIARSVIDAPYPLGVALAVGGLLAFFFAPRAMVKNWKSKNKESGE